jgi:hypothetical protein
MGLRTRSGGERRRDLRPDLAGVSSLAPSGEEQGYQDRSIVGFRKEAARARYIPLGWRMPARCENDLNIRTALVDAARQFEPVEIAWHIDVCEKGADLGVADDLGERLLRVASINRCKPCFFQNVCRVHPQQWFVIDDQDR